MIQIVEHAPQEGPYAIGTAIAAAGLPMRVCRTWAGDSVPETADDLVGLVVMGGAMAAYEDFPGRSAELALLRAALEAEVPVLGVCLGAQLLAVAAGGVARPGNGAQIGWADVRMAEAAHADALFAAVPDRLRVLHWHGDTMDLPVGATLLASCDRYPVQAFRIGGSAWGTQFHLEVDETAVGAFADAFREEAATAPGVVESAPAELAALARHRDGVFKRFAAFVAERAEQTATRAFFTRRAATWEERFAHDGPRYAAAVDRMGLRPGHRALDLGCGTGRALPALRAHVGDEGLAIGIDLTPAMLTAALREGRDKDGHLLWPTPATSPCRPPPWTRSSARAWSTMYPTPPRPCANGPESPPRAAPCSCSTPPAAPNAPPATAAPSTRTTRWPRRTSAPPCGRPAGTCPATRTPRTTSWPARHASPREPPRGRPCGSGQGGHRVRPGRHRPHPHGGQRLCGRGQLRAPRPPHAPRPTTPGRPRLIPVGE